MIRKVVKSIMKGKSISRALRDTYIEENFYPSGNRIVDLGGGNPEKLAFVRKRFKNRAFYRIDIDKKYAPEIVASLERGVPLKSESVDTIMLLSVLEHIYNWENLLKESYRVLRSGGMLFFYVPFLINFHPHPMDYFRFSSQALDRKLKEIEFSDIRIVAVGGIASVIARYTNVVLRYKALRAANSIFWLVMGKLWLNSEKKTGETVYPLGYFVVCRK